MLVGLRFMSYTWMGNTTLLLPSLLPFPLLPPPLALLPPLPSPSISLPPSFLHPLSLSLLPSLTPRFHVSMSHFFLPLPLAQKACDEA